MTRSRALSTLLWAAPLAVILVVTCKELVVPYLAADYTRKGHFEIAARTYDMLGHRTTKRSLTYVGSSRRIPVASRFVAARIADYDQDRILYEYCSEEGAPDCGIHYFDGHTKKQWKVSTQHSLSETAWSADNRSLVLIAQYQLDVVDLNTGRATDMSDALGLGNGKRSVRFGRWSYDLHQIVVRVGEYLDRTPPFVRVAEDLVIIDLDQLTAQYVATAFPHGWDASGYDWKLVDGRLVFYTRGTGSVHDNDTVYVKTRDQLPPRLEMFTR